MKNRYITTTLILITLITYGILIKADSQIQPAPLKFKVAVDVECKENQAHQSQAEGAIKRELRSLGDVQIVGSDIRNALWEYRLNLHLIRLENSYRNINSYAYSLSFYAKVPIEHFDPHWQEYYREFPVVYIPTLYTGEIGINTLESLGKIAANNFDKTYLQPQRDTRTRYSR